MAQSLTAKLRSQYSSASSSGFWYFPAVSAALLMRHVDRTAAPRKIPAGSAGRKIGNLNFALAARGIDRCQDALEACLGASRQHDVVSVARKGPGDGGTTPRLAPVTRIRRLV